MGSPVAKAWETFEELRRRLDWHGMRRKARVQVSLEKGGKTGAGSGHVAWGLCSL